MVAKLNIDMREVTRLTRTGRLSEAVTLIRGALRGTTPAPAPAGTGHPRQLAPSPQARMAPDEQTPPEPRFGRADQSLPSGMPQIVRDTLGQLASLTSGSALKSLNPVRFEALGGLGRAASSTPVQDGARFEERDFVGEAGHLGYKLYVPSRYAGQPLPLVVMLHGCTQSPDDFAAGTRMNDLAEEHLFLVAYPAQSKAANASKCWNWFNAADQQRGRGEPALIAGITREVMDDFAVDQARIYAAGLSAGGAAAAILAATYPDLYAAVGVHSGLACGAARDMAGAFSAMRQGAPAQTVSSRPSGQDRIPTIVFHGDGDKTVNAVNGTQVIEQAAGGATLQSTIVHGEAPGGIAYTRTIQANHAGRPLLEQWVLHGAGHAWSGGSPAGSYTEPRGPDASREMVRFFLEHAR